MGRRSTAALTSEAARLTVDQELALRAGTNLPRRDRRRLRDNIAELEARDDYDPRTLTWAVNRYRRVTR